MQQALNQLYPGRVTSLQNRDQIPAIGFMVYVLGYNNEAIVLGSGGRRRSEVIFDDVTHITNSHIKALAVRLYTLFGTGRFSRFIILCKSKEEAAVIEKHLHTKLGGNTLIIQDEICSKLFENIDPESTTYFVLKLALLSYYDGLSDLKKWRANGLLRDHVWKEICTKLQLNQVKRFAKSIPLDQANNSEGTEETCTTS